MNTVDENKIIDNFATEIAGELGKRIVTADDRYGFAAYKTLLKRIRKGDTWIIKEFIYNFFTEEEIQRLLKKEN